MSSSLPESSTSTPNIQPVFENTLEDLTAHPLAAQVPKSAEKDKKEPELTTPEEPANATEALPPATEETPAEGATEPDPPTDRAARPTRRLGTRIAGLFQPRSA